MKYIIDIDGTICKEVFLADGKKDYANHIPYMDRIAKVNALFDAGHHIKYMTARGITSKIDYFNLTNNQLVKWGAKFTELDVGNKPHYDIWIDDKAFWSENFLEVPEKHMSKIPMKGGDEYDALSKNSRKFYNWSAGQIKKIKRKYNKRFRKDGILDPKTFDKSKMKYTDGDNT